MSFGERLFQLRKNAGYSRVEFADKIGVPHTTLRNYETGAREPGHLFLVSMAKEFSVSVDYLLGISKTKQLNNTVAEGYSATKQKLIDNWDEMNELGHEKLLEYSELLLKDNQYLVCLSAGAGTA